MEAPEEVMPATPVEAAIDEERDPTVETTVVYKAKNGELKELRIIQPVAPGQLYWTCDDVRRIAVEIARILRDEA
jgi:hypothetical protein